MFAFELDKRTIDRISLTIRALVIARSVSSGKIIPHISGENADAAEQAHYRLLKDQELSPNFLLPYVLVLVGTGRYDLCIDRTEFKGFKGKWFNILMATIRINNIGIPVFWKVYEKQGALGQNIDISFVNELFSLLNLKRINTLYADREYIGERWISELERFKVNYVLRIRKNMLVKINGECKTVERLYEASKRKTYRNVQVNGHIVSLYGDTAKEDPVFVMTNGYNNRPFFRYKYRWSIEVCFQNLKKRGFDLEATHLEHSKRLSNLIFICVFAMIACLSIHKYGRLSTKCKNGYPKKSDFRLGLDLLTSASTEDKPLPKFEDAYKIWLLELRAHAIFFPP